VRLPWERRHRDGRRSDFREGGVTGTGGGRTSVTIVPVRSHTSARSVTKMPGTSHFPAPGGPFRAGFEGSETRCADSPCYGTVNPRSASVTVGQHGRKRGVLAVSVTTPDLRHGSVPLPSPPRHAPVPDPPRLPYPALSPRPQPAQGRGETAGSPSLALRGPRPFPAPACGVTDLPGRQLAGASRENAASLPNPRRSGRDRSRTPGTASASSGGPDPLRTACNEGP